MTDGRRTASRRAQQADIARAHWTLEQRKAHAKRYAPPSLHARIDAITGSEWPDYVTMRASQYSAEEAVEYVESLRRQAAS